MIPEAPFLFSVAALSVTLAGFAGLVAAFRRGSEWTAMTVFRLREIAEFGLGNALVALLAIPLATTLGDLAAALRICGVIGVVFVLAGGLLLIRRRRRLALPPEPGWYVLGGATDVGARGGPRDSGRGFHRAVRVAAPLPAFAADARVRARARISSS